MTGWLQGTVARRNRPQKSDHRYDEEENGQNLPEAPGPTTVVTLGCYIAVDQIVRVGM